MELAFVAPTLRALDAAHSAELLACCAWADERPLRGVAGLLDWRFAGRLAALVRAGFFRGERDEVLLVPGRPHLSFEKLLVVGLGARADFDEATFRSATERLLATLVGMRVRRAVVELPGRASGAIAAARSLEILMEMAGTSDAHDAWQLVEPAEEHPAMLQRAADERRRQLRA